MTSGARDRPPLAGTTVLVTRAAGEEQDLTVPLAALGARVLHVPALEFAPPADPAPLARAIERWDEHDWVVLTSPRGVAAVAGALRAAGRDPAASAPRRLAVVGPATGEAARALGWEPRLMPERFHAEEVLDRLLSGGTPVRGLRVLLPLAEAASDVLAAGLAAAGARVERVTAYRSVRPTAGGAAAAALAAEAPDLVTLTSPSSARNTLELIGPGVLAAPAAVIGPVTARAAERLGYRVVAVADEHTVSGLLAAVVRWGERR